LGASSAASQHVPPPPDPNEAPIRSSDVADEGVLDRAPADGLVKERLNGSMDIRGSHRLGSVDQHLSHGVDYPAWTMGPLSAAQGSSWLATARAQLRQLLRKVGQAWSGVLSGERADQLFGHLLDVRVKIMVRFASGCAHQ
jgi:hypothetical protein